MALVDHLYQEHQGVICDGGHSGGPGAAAQLADTCF